MTIKRFEEIEAWQVARQLTKEVYYETRQLPMRRDWRYCSQIQSAAVSMMSNIAEGFHSQTTMNSSVSCRTQFDPRRKYNPCFMSASTMDIYPNLALMNFSHSPN